MCMDSKDIVMTILRSGGKISRRNGGFLRWFHIYRICFRAKVRVPIWKKWLDLISVEKQTFLAHTSISSFNIPIATLLSFSTFACHLMCWGVPRPIISPDLSHFASPLNHPFYTCVPSPLVHQCPPYGATGGTLFESIWASQCEKTTSRMKNWLVPIGIRLIGRGGRG